MLQTTQIISDVCFITDHVLTPAQLKPKSLESRRNSFFSSFFTRGGCASCLRACLGARLLPQSYQYPNLSEGVDRVGGQLRGDKECPFSGVTKSGRVWRKVLASGARCVLPVQTLLRYPYSSRVQSHASISVCTLEIPNTDSHIPLFGHRKVLHTLIGMGSASLAAAVPYSKRRLQFPNFPRRTVKS